MGANFGLHEQSRGQGLYVVCVRGEVDLLTIGDLKAAVRRAFEHEGADLVFDLTAATFVDSSGLVALVGGQRAARAHGGRLVVVNVDPGIARSLSITALDQLLTVVDSVEEALRLLEPARAG